jgi:hypothetical protein
MIGCVAAGNSPAAFVFKGDASRPVSRIDHRGGEVLGISEFCFRI